MERSVYVFNHAKPFEELPEKVTGEIFVGLRKKKETGKKKDWGLGGVGWIKGLVTHTHTIVIFLLGHRITPSNEWGDLGKKIIKVGELAG